MSKLIADEEEVRRFCRTFLLPYERPRILQCVARKKYANGEMNTGCLILERSALRFDRGRESEDAFVRELRKFELLAENGLYSEKQRGTADAEPRSGSARIEIKPEWMVPYITAFGLDEDDAADAFVAKVVETRQHQRKALEKSKHKDTAPSMANVMSKMQTLLHQHPCRSFRWLKLDVDTKDPTLVQQLQESMKGATIVFAVESRGGYHVVLEKGPWCKSLYKFARDVNEGVPKEDAWITIENNSGPMLAIPGTRQGGFVVAEATDIWRRGVC